MKYSMGSQHFITEGPLITTIVTFTSFQILKHMHYCGCLFIHIITKKRERVKKEPHSQMTFKRDM